MKRIHTKYLKVAIAFVVLLCLTACGASGWQKQYDLGTRYLSEGNYEEAVIAFTAAIKIDKKRPQAYIGRGNAYIGTGETDETLKAALDDYTKAIELDETNTDAWLGLADVYIRQGEYDKATETLQQALEKTNQNQAIAEKLKEVESGIYKDSRGNERKRIGYDEAGNIKWYHSYTYDRSGRVDTVTSYDAAGNQTGYVECSYDENGNQLVSYSYSAGEKGTGQISKVVCEFDGNKRVRQTFYNHDGNIYCYEIPEYDTTGNIVRETKYDEGGTILGSETLEYDAQNHLIKRNMYSRDGTLRASEHREYDGNGKLVRQTYYKADGKVDFYIINEHNEAGKSIRNTKYDSDGKVIEVAE